MSAQDEKANVIVNADGSITCQPQPSGSLLPRVDEAEIDYAEELRRIASDPDYLRPTNYVVDADWDGG